LVRQMVSASAGRPCATSARAGEDLFDRVQSGEKKSLPRRIDAARTVENR
jgi:hypothetical protein